MTGGFQPSGIVTLTTDFGLEDTYVGIMKGVILSITRQTQIIDYTHGIRPGNIVEGAYLLSTGYRYFPRGTVHVAVVDPGVGSSRRAIAFQTPDVAFVGPDNGLFGLVIEDLYREWGGDVRIIELTEARFWLPHISATFHGRDIFAPVAAHIVAGVPLAALGRPIDGLTPAQLMTPQPYARQILQGHIIHVDRFGNCITNVTQSHLRDHGIGGRIVVEIIDQQLAGLFRTYSDGPTGVPMCLIGSSGHVEISVRNGNAARLLGVDIGDRFRIRGIDDSRM
ncbi:MAG TPA: SAM-dependent chlorinase/fluorinase [Herpetosiphonaceae bacterium]